MHPTVTRQLAGTTLGRFRVSRQMGAGAMGVVYEAFDLERRRTVALKTLNYLEPEAIYRLKNEFRSLAGVAHPNLVQMHELSCVGEQWFFVMDHVEGVTFTEYFRALADLPEGRAPGFYAQLVEAMGELIRGVAALHEHGKIHRDLKPSNVLVDRTGRVVILDFGLSSDALAPPDQSGTGLPCGTPLYMAPETFAGEPQGPAADWYAVGLILYEVLVGHLPFGGQTHQLISMKLFGRAQPPRALLAETPEALNDVCLRLLARDPAQRPSGKELETLFPPGRGERPRSTRRPRANPLVGRARELGVLRVAFENVVASRTALVSLSGESGIGKTALVEAFLEELREQDDVKIFRGRCYEHESVPYKAFDQLVDAMSHYLSQASETEAMLAMPRDPGALATLFPVLARVPVIRASARPLPRDPTEQRRLGFAAFRETLCRIADRQKLVLFVDDLQWSDPDSELLFKHVFTGRLPPACLLISCSRQPHPDALAGVLAGIEQAQHEPMGYSELRLRGLTAEESSELARQSGLEGPVWQRAVRTISNEAKGSPFFVVALARDAAQSDNAGDSLQSFMRRWVGSLAPGPARLLEVIAVAGRPVHEAVVAAVVDSPDLLAEAAKLASQHFIQAWPTPTRRFECYHDQIRETVVAGLAPERLRRLNASLARALEQNVDADAEQLATHFLAAGERSAGSHYAELAGDAAHAALAFLDAARWYELALDNSLDPAGGRLASNPAEAGDVDAGDIEAGHVEPMDDARARRLRTKLGEAFTFAGHGVVASRWFLDAAASAPPEQAITLRQRAAELLLVSGHVDAGVRVLEQVLRHVRMRVATSPRHALASLLWERARLNVRGFGFRERKPSEIPPAELLKIDVCWSVALGLSLVDPIRATDFQTRNLWLSLESGEPQRIARALAMEVSFRASRGSRADAGAQRLAERALALAQRVNSPHVLGLATFSAGFAHYLVGRWKTSHALLARAEQILIDQPGAIWELNATQRFQLNALAFIGDLPSIARRVPELIQRARESGNLHSECALRVRLSSLLSLSRDEPENAIAETKEMMVRWSQEGFHLQHYNELFSLVAAALYQGRGDEAFQRIQRTWPRFEKSLLMRTQAVRVEARHLRTRACLSALQHGARNPELRPLLERDIRHLRREGVGWASAFASFAQGLLDAVSGRTEAGLRGLELAEQQLLAGDMSLLGMAARFRRGQLQGGERGRQAMNEARDWLVERGVKHPVRFVQHSAPGW